MEGGLKPGQVFVDRYRIDKAIGRGGYGTVYRATRSEDDRVVALKVMNAWHDPRPVDIKRFEREAALVSQLRQPNIVQVLDFGHSDHGLPFIVFELLRGHSLKFRLKKEGALSLWRAGQIALQVLRALGAAHAIDVAHRDIKPANIFLCAGRGSDFVKVLDFGIAKNLVKGKQGATQLTNTGQMIGSPSYMSPEQVRGGTITFSSDLYALGLVLAELLTGKRVVNGDTNIDILMDQISDDEHRLSEAVRDSPFCDIITRAIRKKPVDRYGSAEEMASDIEATLQRHHDALHGRAAPSAPGSGQPDAGATTSTQTPSSAGAPSAGSVLGQLESTVPLKERAPSPRATSAMPAVATPGPATPFSASGSPSIEQQLLQTVPQSPSAEQSRSPLQQLESTEPMTLASQGAAPPVQPRSAAISQPHGHAPLSPDSGGRLSVPSQPAPITAISAQPVPAKQGGSRGVIAVLIGALLVGAGAAGAGYFFAGSSDNSGDATSDEPYPATETTLSAAQLRARLTRQGFAITKEPQTNRQSGVTTTSFAISRGQLSGVIMLLEYQDARTARYAAKQMSQSGSIVTRAGSSVASIIFGPDEAKAATLLTSVTQ